MNFTREYFGDDPDNFLSYITDPLSLNLISIGKTAYKFDKTIALTNSTGNSYQYPKACFLGDKQVYPPIINEEIHDIRGVQGSTAFIIRTNGAPINEKTYIFPRTFCAETFSGYTNQPTGHYTYKIPSFGPNENNNSQWAYQYGNSIYIKDPQLIKKIPYQQSYQFTVNSNANYTFSSYYSKFKIYINYQSDGPAATTQLTYQTTNYPLSYALQNNTVILRRQFQDISEEQEPFIEYVTTKETQQNQYSYYTYRYFWKGNEITNLDDIYAYVMPKRGIGSTLSGNVYVGGSNPTYFLVNYNNFSNYNTNFTIASMPNNEPINTDAILYKFYSYKGALFNLHFIKVQGNENMNAFGQQIKYNNHLAYDATEALTHMPVYGQNGKKVNVILNSSISNKLAKKQAIDELIHIEYNDNPKKNSEIVSSKNVNYNNFGTIGFRHKTENYLANMNSNTFKYMSYSTARTFKDVTSIDLNFHALQTGELLTDVIINSNNFSNSLSTSTAGSTGTYAYCYLAADIISQWGDKWFIINKVLSESYVCIRSFLMQGGQNNSSITTYNIHLRALDE